MQILSKKPNKKNLKKKLRGWTSHILAESVRVNRVQMDVLVGCLAGVLFAEEPVELKAFEPGVAIQNKLDRTGFRIFDWDRVYSGAGEQREHVIVAL